MLRLWALERSVFIRVFLWDCIRILVALLPFGVSTHGGKGGSLLRSVYYKNC